MKSKNLIEEESISFAISIIHLFTDLKNQKEFVLSKQILKSGTSIGANIQEGINGESKADFIHKLSIAQKETAETIYWLKLLKAGNFISQYDHSKIDAQAQKILRILRSIILTSKGRKIHNS